MAAFENLFANSLDHKIASVNGINVHIHDKLVAVEVIDQIRDL